jgi:NADP-dependent 3-hydroxy acid dehydrogenase YdfG
MDLELRDKVALVTGSTAGIGHASARSVSVTQTWLPFSRPSRRAATLNRW